MHLSQGEQHRLDIASKLGFDDVLIDEFSSNLDRRTASKVGAGTTCSRLRRHGTRNVLLLSCNCNFVEALPQPRQSALLVHVRCLRMCLLLFMLFCAVSLVSKH